MMVTITRPILPLWLRQTRLLVRYQNPWDETARRGSLVWLAGFELADTVMRVHSCVGRADSLRHTQSPGWHTA
jgi:hypothetical protein